ncbi:MAG: hypothetical protein RL129_1395 [Actinomycetota bacterium]
MKATRFLIATCGIFAGSVVGHLIGSAKLAIVMALAQFGTHFFFSTSQNVELRMAISHLVFGILSYQLVVRMDAIYESILSAFEYLVVAVFERVEPIVFLAIESFATVRVLHLRFIALEIARRGPPVAN